MNQETHSRHGEASVQAFVDAEALNNRGNALLELGRDEDALASYDQALVLKHDYAHAYNNRGLALLNLKRHVDALASLNLAIEFNPNFALAFNNRGYVLQQMGRPEEALDSYARALALQPDDVSALNNHGNALLDLQRNQEALTSYGNALRLKPYSAGVLNNRGLALLNLNRHAEALADFDVALELDPDFALALNNRGNALRDMGRYEEAARFFARVVQIAPDYDYGPGNLLHAQILYCDWAQHEQSVLSIAVSVASGKRVVVPFPFLAFSQSAPAQLQCARIFVADKCPVSPSPLWQGQRYRHDRIRVAYLSADFHNHATAFLMAELFEAHDKDRFETTAICFGPEVRDSMRERLQPSFDRFVDAGGMSDLEVARLILQSEIDIAIDLKGFTTHCRTGILAYRPAPVQVNYLGYPGTMGADYIDYIIADRYLIPAEHQVHYSEQVVYLPDSYQPNDRKRVIGVRTPSRAELKLPESGFVFCCFNNNFKIAPAMFDVWMRLLNRVSGSVLWLLEDNPVASANLRRESEKRGVAPERLVFAARIDMSEHLARQRQADLFLDTLPCNAHTTASDALWAGLPILTCMGETFAGRVAASLLNAVDLPEMICHGLDEYEALALGLATAPAALAEIRARLERNLGTCALFDSDRFRGHIESAYVTMWERYQRGEPPASFTVPAQARRGGSSFSIRRKRQAPEPLCQLRTMRKMSSIPGSLPPRSGGGERPSRLNVGCGRNILDGWINLDCMSLPGVDVVADLDRLGSGQGGGLLPLRDSSIGEFLLSHVLEHIRSPLPLMQELWRVAKPNARMTVRCPYGSSDDAWEDPTHVRSIFLQSFGYFSQPYYWRADYGYRGDWKIESITLWVAHAHFLSLQGPSLEPTPAMVEAVMSERNVVREMVVRLVALKPAREPRRELQEIPALAIRDSLC